MRTSNIKNNIFYCCFEKDKQATHCEIFGTYKNLQQKNLYKLSKVIQAQYFQASIFHREVSQQLCCSLAMKLMTMAFSISVAAWSLTTEI